MCENQGLKGLRKLLVEDGMISSADVLLEPLSGGVSCDVIKVSDGDRCFVTKRALSKLRVEADWFADVGRNRYEHLYMQTVAKVVPDSIPEILHTNDEKKYFCMVWLGAGWENWKELLLAGDCDRRVATEAARILAAIHRHTAGKTELAQRFDTHKNFFELRLDPYLVTTSLKHLALKPYFDAEVQRLASTRECLVHGDYSPKNLLVRDGRIMVLDCEVAVYAAASFDFAFLLSHLFLKGLYHSPSGVGWDTLIDSAVHSYFTERSLNDHEQKALDQESARLTLMLMLARVDGKSPVEYFARFPRKETFIRRFVTHYLPNSDNLLLSDLRDAWINSLQESSP